MMSRIEIKYSSPVRIKDVRLTTSRNTMTTHLKESLYMTGNADCVVSASAWLPSLLYIGFFLQNRVEVENERMSISSR